ncbi:hypothetical protein GCM10010495_55230 [Kitasatospora herbaricolor]|nr:hypothetical protein GCM10010495_55230 [Kitasatospora herbaricolor]
MVVGGVVVGGVVGAVGVVTVMLSRLTLPLSAVLKLSATVLAPAAKVTACSLVPQVSQFAVAGRLTCRTFTPFTDRLNVIAEPVPFA